MQIRKRDSAVFFALLITVFWLKDVCFALAMKTSECILENLQLGETYNLRTLRNYPFIVNNNSDRVVIIEIVTEIPRKENIKRAGYEPIPDPSWVRVFPNRIRLEPGAESFSDIIISIPNDQSLVGKSYQCDIIVNTVEGLIMPTGSGLALGTSLGTNIKFSIAGLAPASIQAMKKKKLFMQLDFDMTPTSLQIGEIDVGRKVDIRKEKGLSLKVTNRGREKLKFAFKSSGNAGRFSVPPGYVEGNPSWLIFKKKIVKVKGLSIKEVELVANIPENEETKGKKYMFLVEGTIENMDVPLATYSRVLLNTK